ncbi:esterase-like activity of phytase family protein [Streptomyces sp. A7024]|uniref:Esterase-like activity of phytase family protein n=1 Tax=Streptomyces coryli TaxID=1128680 RepID=A0A6G4U9H5_9ACTN|nr:esterase-like activity of phytase family protein [Streptomyces coryli]NGN67841.1 esterase-like activity of phytase family protein [Streptomyces coryli]
MRLPVRVLGVLAACLAVLLPASAVHAEPGGSFTFQDSRISESSGLAASRQHDGVYWTVNDSGDGPYVYAVDGKSGETRARIAMRGVGQPRDVEAISIGPGNQIYVGDIGDNAGGTWDHVWIYRFPEPKQLRDQTVNATQFDVVYDGGPRDAEALMIHPKTGRAYIASKKKDGGAAMYAGPAKLTPGTKNVFRRIAPINLWVTDGAFSPDGEHLVLRSYFGGRMYDWKDGRPKEAESVSPPLQRQGESVTFTADGGALMYGTEGARTEVTRADLPASARPSGSAEADGSGGSSSGPGEGENRNLVVGVLTFGAAAVLVLGLKRVFRRR